MARQYYRLINALANIELVDGARDFRLMNRQMVDSILQICEYNRFSKGIFAWVGFKTKWIEYDNRQRAAGKTKWSFWKLYVYSLDGIMAFSTTPWPCPHYRFGVLPVLVAYHSGHGCQILDLGWFALRLAFSGLHTVVYYRDSALCTGIVGQYVSRTYMEAKRRPIYIVKEYSDECC